MRIKTYLIFLFTFFLTTAYGQESDTSIRAAYSKNDSSVISDNLFLIGKIWGFLKYYHPVIGSGKYNWDKELIDFLPGYVRVKSVKERSDTLESWIKKFGEVPVCDSCTDTILNDAKLTPNFSWINNRNFSTSLVATLKNIIKNRIQHGQYYTKFQSQDGINYGIFQHEPGYNNLKFPNDSYGLLSVFRFWNAIEYWYPYKYDLPVSWDSVLKQSIKKMLTNKNAHEYALTIEELITAIHDGHGYFRSALTEEIAGKYYMPFTIRIVENKILVTSLLNDSLSSLSNVKVGDIVESIENIRLPDLIEKYSNVIPASNYGSLLDKMSYSITRTDLKKSNITVKRNDKVFKTVTYNYTPRLYPPVNLNPPYFSYQKDSSFCILNNNIGYINVGIFNRKDSLKLQEMVSNVSKLILDNRQNQDEQKGTGGGDIIADLILPPDNKFVRLSTSQPLYPGVFTLTEPNNMNLQGKKNYFKGKVIILINESTISVGEILTMAFQKAVNAKTLGTTTSGADGNVTYITLPAGIFVQFTGLGVYYPNGAETQRVGIKPDIWVKPTIEGYQKNNDEQLKRAIKYLEK